MKRLLIGPNPRRLEKNVSDTPHTLQADMRKVITPALGPSTRQAGMRRILGPVNAGPTHEYVREAMKRWIWIKPQQDGGVKVGGVMQDGMSDGYFAMIKTGGAPIGYNTMRKTFNSGVDIEVSPIPYHAMRKVI